MSSTKPLIMIDYHYNTETGDHHIGEIDFSLYGTLNPYLEEYGRKGMEEIISMLAYLIYRVRRDYNAAIEKGLKTTTMTNSEGI